MHHLRPRLSHPPQSGFLLHFPAHFVCSECNTLPTQPQTVFNRNYLYYYAGQVAQLLVYCLAIASFLTFWLVIIDVMSKQNPTFSTFRSGFWIYKSLFFVVFFGAHFARLFDVLGYVRKESGAQNSQSNPDAFEKLGGWSFVRIMHLYTSLHSTYSCPPSPPPRRRASL